MSPVEIKRTGQGWIAKIDGVHLKINGDQNRNAGG